MVMKGLETLPLRAFKQSEQAVALGQFLEPRVVAAGGHLVLAGILERQADELKEAYAPWLQLQVSDAEDGWILMTAAASR